MGFLLLLLVTPSISAVNYHVANDATEQEKNTQKQETQNIKRSIVWLLWYIAYMTARFGIFEIISEFFSFFTYRLAERWNLSSLLPPK